MEKKNLSNEFRATMEETKELLAMSAMTSGALSGMDDGKEVIAGLKAMKLLNRFVDLCSDLFEMQIQQMDKLDKCFDKYLAAENKKSEED
jgi:hypothetical protein